VVMLDREPIALQCSLLSAQACGVASVQDYTQHAEPEAASGSQHQSLPSQTGSDIAQDSTSGDAAPDCQSTTNQQASVSQVCQAMASNMYAEALNVMYVVFPFVVC
jgi:hypothetical protein